MVDDSTRKPTSSTDTLTTVTKSTPAPDQDCTPCKVTGVLVLGGFSAYWNHLRLSTPKSARMQRIFLGTTSLGFLGLALMRVAYSRIDE